MLTPPPRWDPTLPVPPLQPGFQGFVESPFCRQEGSSLWPWVIAFHLQPLSSPWRLWFRLSSNPLIRAWSFQPEPTWGPIASHLISIRKTLSSPETPSTLKSQEGDGETSTGYFLFCHKRRLQQELLSGVGAWPKRLSCLLCFYLCFPGILDTFPLFPWSLFCLIVPRTAKFPKVFVSVISFNSSFLIKRKIYFLVVLREAELLNAPVLENSLSCPHI